MVTNLQGVKIQVTCQDRYINIMTNRLDREPIHLIHSNGPTGPLSHTWGTHVVLNINGTCWETPLSYPSGWPSSLPRQTPSWEPFPAATHRSVSSGLCLALSMRMLQDLAGVYNQVSQGRAGLNSWSQRGQSQREGTNGDRAPASTASTFIPWRPSISQFCEEAIILPICRRKTWESA